MLSAIFWDTPLRESSGTCCLIPTTCRRTSHQSFCTGCLIGEQVSVCMCVSMCACVWACVHVCRCMCAYVWFCTGAYVWFCTGAYVCFCTGAYVCMCTGAYVCMCIGAYVWFCTGAYVCMCTGAYVYVTMFHVLWTVNCVQYNLPCVWCILQWQWTCSYTLTGEYWTPSTAMYALSIKLSLYEGCGFCHPKCFFC